MVDSDTEAGGEAATLFPQSVGERLRNARTKSGLDLNDVATRTRVPVRHLEAIEKSDYSALPSITYAIGFVRSYARAVGADEVALAADVRAELGRAPPEAADSPAYEPMDPARVPSRLLAWTAAIVGLLILGGYLVWKSDIFGGGQAAPDTVVATAPADETNTIAPAPIAAAAPSATGQVVLTANAAAWVRIYDKADKVLFEKEMAPGESFTVPADADTPMIRTGRADAIKVTIDGREVAPLGPAERTVRDVGVSAAALSARPPVAATPPTASPLVAPGSPNAPQGSPPATALPSRDPPRL